MWVARDKFGSGYYVFCEYKLELRPEGDWYRDEYLIEICPRIIHKWTNLRMKKGTQKKIKNIVINTWLVVIHKKLTERER